MQVAGLVVVEGVGPSRRRRVVAGHLVGEHVEVVAVGIHEGGC